MSHSYYYKRAFIIKAMIDVDEVYKLPQSILKPDDLAKDLEVKASLNDDNDAAEKNSAQTTTPAISESLESILSQLNLYKSGRFNQFERHVNQLFIRGDNIVTVALTDN
jgi:hypothetical protein